MVTKMTEEHGNKIRMSKELGTIAWWRKRGGSIFRQISYKATNMSEETAKKVDAEVKNCRQRL